jgi:oxygen-dependent protoporphyrinogen oxidase
MSNPESAIRNPQSAIRVAVVGGGITGLAAANRMIELCREQSRPLELTLFEARSRPGGVVATERRDDYLIEHGADSFITNKPWGIDLCGRIGLEEELIPTDETYRRSLVLRKGKPVPVPEGFMLLAPAKVWPVLTSPVFSPLGKLRMGCEYFIPRRTEDGDESLAAFVRRRFGREALERLVQPLVGGIYTSDPEKLSLQATMPRFLEMEREYRSLIRASKKQAGEGSTAETSGSGARYGLFVTLRNGLSSLLEALRARVAAAGAIRFETAMRNVKPAASGGWQLEFGDGTAAEFDAVILAVRAFQAGEIVQSFDLKLAEELRQIEYASTAIVLSGHRLAHVSHPLDAFGLVVPAIENRKVLAVSFASRKFPGRAPDGRVLLRTFVGGAMQPESMRLSDAELVALVRSELAELLGVGGEPDFMDVVRFNNAMPQYHVGHLDRVAQIESLTGKHPGLQLAGNAYHGVGIPDCIHSGEQAAERTLNIEYRTRNDEGRSQSSVPSSFIIPCSIFA